ncbi:hypothetical protein DdX_05983 [Ditylenchus destructor]|uniref:Uncharacterized protein n=1 Tax=Ditylenchus destructor TaxID=166010 RepID=A0AAD4R9J1_9BILA|nr:hypothetical protein DdX_05983 [Ditylenchus destructor]
MPLVQLVVLVQHPLLPQEVDQRQLPVAHISSPSQHHPQQEFLLEAKPRGRSIGSLSLTISSCSGRNWKAMSCIRKNSIQIFMSKDELDCMRDSIISPQKSILSTNLGTNSSGSANGSVNGVAKTQAHLTYEDELGEEKESSPLVANTCWNGHAPILSSSIPRPIKHGPSSSIPNKSFTSNPARRSSASASLLLKKALANRINPQLKSSTTSDGLPAKYDSSKLPNSTETSKLSDIAENSAKIEIVRKKCDPSTKVDYLDLKENISIKEMHQNGNEENESGSPSKEMTSSILVNPAWYRDSDGRTGFRPEEYSRAPNLQRSEIKPVKQVRSASSTSLNGHTKAVHSPAYPRSYSSTLPFAYSTGESSILARPSVILRTIPTNAVSAVIRDVRNPFTSPQFTAELPPNGRSHIRPPARRTHATPRAYISNLDSPTDKSKSSMAFLRKMGGSLNGEASTSSPIEHSLLEGKHFTHKSVTFAEPERIELQTDSISQIQRELCSNDYKISRLESEDSDLENPTQPENISEIAPKPTMSDLEWRMIQSIYSNLIGQYDHNLLAAFGRDINATQSHADMDLRPQSGIARTRYIKSESDVKTACENPSIYAGNIRRPIIRSASGYLEKSPPLEKIPYSPIELIRNGDQKYYETSKSIEDIQQHSFYDNMALGGTKDTAVKIDSYSQQSTLEQRNACEDSGELYPTASNEDIFDGKNELWLRSKFLKRFGRKITHENQDDQANLQSIPGCSFYSTTISSLENSRHQEPRDTRDPDRRMSYESVISSGEESIMSATSIRAENKVRRYFNY